MADDTLSDDVLLNLNTLRLALKSFMKPEVLGKFADLVDEMGGDQGLVERYDFFSKNSENGSDCRYARMAKHYFLEERADNVAKLIVWLHNNWAKEALPKE